MIGAEAGLTGGQPELHIKPVDQSLPQCCKPVLTDEGMLACTRKQGHYGKCGVADANR